MHLRRVALVVIVALWLGVSGSAMAQVRGGTAVIVAQADPGHLNPANSTSSLVHAVADSLYNALIGLDRDLKPSPTARGTMLRCRRSSPTSCRTGG